MYGIFSFLYQKYVNVNQKATTFPFILLFMKIYKIEIKQSRGEKKVGYLILRVKLPLLALLKYSYEVVSSQNNVFSMQISFQIKNETKQSRFVAFRSRKYIFP